MRPILATLLLMFLTCQLITSEAYAGRFGGGRSFGVQRSHSSLFSQRSAPSRSSFFKRPQQTSRWGSALGGLLIGGLLASLFMGHGLGTGLLSWLLVGGLIFFVVNLLRKRTQPAFQSGRPHAFQSERFQAAPSYAASGSASTYPPGFSLEPFLREAKVTFMRLQTAYDQKNRQDLNEFTTPEVFAEIQMQWDERGDAPNITEVVNLEAELLDVSKQAIGTIASVRFTGFVKENQAPMTALNEIWHFRQFADNPRWLVAGLQSE